jgi:hypothetical protein
MSRIDPKKTDGTPPLEWRNPPPRNSRATSELMVELRAHPGEWAVIAALKDSNSASSSACARRRTFGPGFEVLTRGSEVFARFIGGAK